MWLRELEADGSSKHSLSLWKIYEVDRSPICWSHVWNLSRMLLATLSMSYTHPVTQWSTIFLFELGFPWAFTSPLLEILISWAWFPVSSVVTVKTFLCNYFLDFRNHLSVFTHLSSCDNQGYRLCRKRGLCQPEMEIRLNVQDFWQHQRPFGCQHSQSINYSKDYVATLLIRTCAFHPNGQLLYMPHTGCRWHCHGVSPYICACKKRWVVKKSNKVR